ncbi:MAG TPA: hypothetical protein VF101_16725 [Gaiellaceae bacterium]
MSGPGGEAELDEERRAHARLVEAEAGRRRLSGEIDVAADLDRVASDLAVLRRCLCGECAPLEARAAVGRLGELVLLARTIAEGETPLQTGVRGGSDLLALSDAEQLVAREAKATAAIRVRALPARLGQSRLGVAWAVDPRSGERVRAKQGAIPYTGRDAASLGIPIDAGENLPYRLLFAALRAGGAWGVSDWYSVDIRRDETRATLYAHGEPEAVAQTLDLARGSLDAVLGALDAAGAAVVG